MKKSFSYIRIGLICLMLFLTFQLNIAYALKLEKPTAGHYHPNDILDWSLDKYPDQKNNISTVPLADRIRLKGEGTSSQDSDGKVMAIMIANATTSGAPAQGGSDYKYGYAFSYWQYVDTLVYWGGSAGEGLIVLPSADFVDSAHKNGVKVVGTVFFPPEAYGGQAKWILDFVKKDDSGNYVLVDKLIEIADTLGFDGWFINEETNTNSRLANELKEFLRQYKQKTDKTIVWYDAMTSDGLVNWQGALNDENKDYVLDNGDKISDELFVDFRWQRDRLSNVDTSVNTAKSLGIDPTDVFMGYDVQPEGNLNAYMTRAGIGIAPLIEDGKPRISLGLYVPDSVMRNISSKQGDDFWNSLFEREAKLWVNDKAKIGETSTIAWEGISNYFAEKTPITSLPFTSSFNLGAGDNFFVNGEIEKQGAFLNRSTQDIMPTYRWLYENKNGNALIPNLDMNDAYYGGSSLKLEGTFTEGGSTKNILFGSDVTLEENMKASIIKKGNAKVNLVLINNADEEFVIEGKEEKSSWDKVVYDLSSLSGQSINKFGIEVITTDSSITKLNIGNITIGEILDDVEIKSFEVLNSEIESGINAKINFKVDTNKSNTLVNIYQEVGDEVVLIGSTNNGYLYFGDAKRPSDEVSKINFFAIAQDKAGNVLNETKTYLEFDFGGLETPIADFIYDKSFVKVGEEVKLEQKASISASSFEWMIPGASIERSEEENVIVTFSKPGVYSVTLKAKNMSGEDTEYKENIITVYDDGYEIENLALKPEVKETVSGTCNIVTEAGKHARDDNSSTKWCDNGNDNPYLIFELENESTITSFEILHASEGGEGAEFNTRNFDILASNDGEEWEKVVEVRDNKDGFTNHATLKRAKFVKLDVLRGEQGGRVARIYEFRVLGFEKELEEVVKNQEDISKLREVYFNTLINDEDKRELDQALLKEYEILREKAKEILDTNIFDKNNDNLLAEKLKESYEKLLNSKNVEKFEIRFKFDGGMLNNSPDDLIIYAKKDEVITIPESPIREGYRFMYWEGSTYYPGDKYVVNGDHTFTAIWEKTENYTVIVKVDEKESVSEFIGITHEELLNKLSELKEANKNLKLVNELKDENKITLIYETEKETPAPNEKEKNNKNDGTTEVKDSGNSKTPDKSDENTKSNDSDNPKTGDYVDVKLLIAFIILLSGILFIIQKRKIGR